MFFANFASFGPKLIIFTQLQALQKIITSDSKNVLLEFFETF